MKFEATIPMTPVAKGRPRLTARGGFAYAYTPQKTRDAEEHLRWQLIRVWRHPPLGGAISLQVTFYMPIPKSIGMKKKIALLNGPHLKRPDADNFLKQLMDSGNGLLWVDDSQIWDIQIKKLYGAPSRTEIVLNW